MKEFSSISVSSYDAASLAERLTEKSAEGWEVTAIVPAGTNICAYLHRERSGADVRHEVAAVAEPTPVATSVPAAASTPVTAASTPAASSAVPTAAATSGSAAPAGWYADPAGRYELRYWNGDQWTEHVSRAGQQYTDPPVA